MNVKVEWGGNDDVGVRTHDLDSDTLLNHPLTQ